MTVQITPNSIFIKPILDEIIKQNLTVQLQDVQPRMHEDL